MADFGGADLDAFRAEARDWLEANFPKSLRDSEQQMIPGAEALSEDAKRWKQAMADKGWGTPTWPKQYGGGGLSGPQARVLQQEMDRIGAYNPVAGMGTSMFGPTLLEYGTEDQKQRHIPPIVRGELRWCQGYSEPGAGSDLAALSTSAVRKGDRYVVNGTKTWITAAQWADWIFVLARTDPHAKKQEGISFILADMRTPGISVRPIETIDGGREINEVHLENVEVPVENLVGVEGRGWTYAKFLLEHERTDTAGIAGCRQQLEQLHERLARERIADQRLSDRIAEVEIELEALAFTELRTLAAESAGKRPGPESSILKIKGTELQQRIAELALDALGPYAERHVAPKYFNLRKASIYAGSNEIQKNIIAKRILKL